MTYQEHVCGTCRYWHCKEADWGDCWVNDCTPYEEEACSAWEPIEEEATE